MSTTLQDDLRGVILDLGDILLRTDLTEDQRHGVDVAKQNLIDIEEELNGQD